MTITGLYPVLFNALFACTEPPTDAEWTFGEPGEPPGVVPVAAPDGVFALPLAPSVERVMARRIDGDLPSALALGGHALPRVRAIEASGVGVYALPEGLSPQAAIAEMERSGQYALVERDSPVYAAGRVDEYRALQWNLDALRAGQAWAHSRGEGAIVAVLDTGVSSGLDGIGVLMPGHDFAEQDSDPSDGNGHGTHVAGTIAQRTGNSMGVAGLAPGAAILPVKVLGDNGGGYTSDVILGVYYAVAAGADVINLSLGGGSYSQLFEDACQYAQDQGVIVVAAAGNNGDGELIYPAGYPAALSVAALDAANELAWYSNWGPALDLSAPGGDTAADRDGDGYADAIWQETWTPTYGWGLYGFQGTSMAAPHVSASLALMISAGAPGAEAIAALTETAEDLGEPGWDEETGHGLVRPAAALARWSMD